MMLPRLLLFLITILLLGTNSRAQTDFEFHQMAKVAKSQLDYSGAVKMMSKAIDLNPKGEYYVERGHLYLGLEKNRKAQNDFKTAMTIDSMSVEPYIGKSLCHMYKQELDSALFVAHIAYILAQNQYEQAKANSMLGEVLLSKDKDDQAFEYFSKSLQLDTTNNRGYKKAAQIAIKQGEYEAAEKLLLKALANDSKDLEILINLAYTYNKLEFFRQSIEYSNMALAFNPLQPLARSNRAFAYLNLGQNERALDDINQSIRSNNKNAIAYIYKGQILLKSEKEDPDKACKCFDKAYSLSADLTTDSNLKELMAQHCGD
jgi:tetratricopeptide (TPR) repeat protein